MGSNLENQIQQDIIKQKDIESKREETEDDVLDDLDDLF